MSNKSNIKNLIIIILGLAVLGFVFLRPSNTPQNDISNTVPVVSGNAEDLVNLLEKTAELSGEPLVYH